MLISLFVLAVVGSFFFAGVETGYISWNPLKVRYRARKVGPLFSMIPRILTDRQRVLTTLLIGNNISNVTATLTFEALVLTGATFGVHGDVVVRAVSVPLLTAFLLVFGEILPKTLYRTYPFRLTFRSIPLLIFFYWLFYPLTASFSFLRKLFVHNSGAAELLHEKREELTFLARAGSEQGTIFDSAENIMENILEMRVQKLTDPQFSSEIGKSGMTKRSGPDTPIGQIEPHAIGVGGAPDIIYLVYSQGEKKRPVAYFTEEKKAVATLNQPARKVMVPFLPPRRISDQATPVSLLATGEALASPFYLLEEGGKFFVLSTRQLLYAVFTE